MSINTPPRDSWRIARIVDIAPSGENGARVTMLMGDTLHQAEWQTIRPDPGDIFRVSHDASPAPLEKIGGASPGAWATPGDGVRWRTPNERGQTRLAALRQRHTIRRAVRDYFDGEGFIEIDAPLLVKGTSPDPAIQSFSVDDRFLTPSTEYQIKRLEAAGFDRIYTLTQNFRRGDHEGPYRNPEFTMLEWARVGASLTQIEQDAEQLVWRAHLAIGGTGVVRFGQHEVALTPPWDRLSVAAAMQRFLGHPLPDFSRAALTAALHHADIPLQDVWRDDAPFLFSLLIDHIQPQLGCGRPMFLSDWPAFETSSARERPGQIVAERSELFIAGIEIADGFPSLTDPMRQQATFARQQQRRQEAAPIDEAYFAALRIGLPSGAGMALGFDRLVMVLTDRGSLRDVLAFAWDEL